MTTSTTDNATISSIAAAMAQPGYLHLTATQTESLADASADDWSSFAAEWNHLVADRYMADGGTYRLRRYSSFTLDTTTGEFLQQPHSPYLQSMTVNHLNGGIERHFEPCTAAFCRNPVLRGLLPALGRAFTQAQGSHRWNIKLHPYRILATSKSAGQPAPEGRHRDGVTYITTLMISRCQITGGRSTVYTNTGSELTATTLLQRGELLLADDNTTLHSVTPILPAEGFDHGHRDVLVIAFTAETP
ncbi:2OG-Fe dioxygenase family protein [Mycolicibacterium sarraceniae]|uniref:2OG-Fe dioxygenase family protein n=1 Tax=Mycolicibacterium sarraceniae TaxID=1534348 RepID=A0A7I7SRK7_9MYCO|nr:2OG-Fe dioxygenase family protein [Mycolicibacterium sarraceniae]BBY59363.1 hypothetical protein MSAR_24990 [Mycolicibacterium sarraceniae]